MHLFIHPKPNQKLQISNSKLDKTKRSTKGVITKVWPWSWGRRSHGHWIVECTNWERDRQSYSDKPIVQRWTTPSSSWRHRWCWWRCSRRLRQRFPLQSSQLQISISVFFSLPPPRFGNDSGGIFIVSFRSRRSLRSEGSRKSVHGARSGLHGAARVSGRVVGPTFPSVARFVDSSSSRISSWRKISSWKNPMPFWLWVGLWK